MAKRLEYFIIGDEARGERVYELLEGLAAFFGALTGIVYFGERFTSGNPTAVIITKAFYSGGSRLAYLRVTNRSTRPMLVELPSKQPEGYFMAAKDHEVEGVVNATVLPLVTAAMDPGEERDFPLLNPYGFGDSDPENYLRAVVYWRFAQPIYWLGNRKVVAAIKKSDFVLLLEK